MAKLIRVYAIVEVPDDFDTVDNVVDAFAADTLIHFATAREGYAGEFVSVGAEATYAIEDM